MRTIEMFEAITLRRRRFAGAAATGRDQAARHRVREAQYPGECGRGEVIKTPMHPFETYAQITALHSVGHMGEISDIVDAILYLKSAAFVTGESFTSTAVGAPATDIAIRLTRKPTKPRVPHRRSESGTHYGGRS